MTTRLDEMSLAGQRVLIRVDFNVPVLDGHITSDLRITQALETINYALSQHAKVILMSHFGRPTEGNVDKAFSLELVSQRLSELLATRVRFVNNPLEPFSVESKEVVLLENVRFLKGEKANDEHLSKQLANLCDVFVMDAFSVCHRAQASTQGVMRFAKKVCVGFSLSKELAAFTKGLHNPQHPLVAIVGGSKVSTKFKVLDRLLDKVDTLVLGGGMANTFLKSKGYFIGDSLFENDWCEQASLLMDKAKALNKTIIIPEDVIVAKEISDQATTCVRALDDIQEGEKILDIGPKTISKIENYLMDANTIVWNGPMGVIEYQPFQAGTLAIARGVAQSKAFSIAGGGDTMVGVEQAKVGDKISYCSTAGGAFLEFLEGRTLPCLETLNDRSQQDSPLKA